MDRVSETQLQVGEDLNWIIFTHLKLCLADAIHNLKWMEIIQIWQDGGQLFSNLAGWYHILSLTFLKCGT